MVSAYKAGVMRNILNDIDSWVGRAWDYIESAMYDDPRIQESVPIVIERGDTVEYNRLSHGGAVTGDIELPISAGGHTFL